MTWRGRGRKWKRRDGQTTEKNETKCGTYGHVTKVANDKFIIINRNSEFQYIVSFWNHINESCVWVGYIVLHNSIFRCLEVRFKIKDCVSVRDTKKNNQQMTITQYQVKGKICRLNVLIESTHPFVHNFDPLHPFVRHSFIDGSLTNPH